MDQSGLCAAWLFENHRQFAARAAYAQKQIERLPEIIQQRKDEAILSMSLARPEIGSLPKGSHSGSSTEHAAIYWEQNVTQDVNLMVNQLYAELRESEYYLDLYNKIITMLDSVYLRSSQNSQPNSDASDVNSRKERGRVFRIARSDPPPAF